MAGESLVPDLPLFHEEAARALRIFRRLRIPDVIGKPTMAEACGPWFFPIVAAMFGSYDPELHRRMIQEFFLLIPKGNSKSSNGGAVMLVATIMNRRPEAEFNFIAPTMSIASYAYKQAVGTIKLDSELDKTFQVRDHIRTIQHRRSGGILQIKAADTDIITGGKSAGTMIDETHEFAKKSKASEVFLELRGALGKRPDGFLFQTTTQSKTPPAGVFKAELNRARDVRDGKVELPLLPILYEFPRQMIKEEKWRERRYWPIVNPNLGRSVDMDFLEREMTTKEREGEEGMILFASQHFNVQIGIGIGSDRWAGADYWQDACDPSITLKTLIEMSEVIVAAADGGGLDDLYGLCLLGRHKVTKDWQAWFRAWAQTDVLKRRKEIAPRLSDFEADGDLVICNEPTQDVREIADIIEQVCDAGLLPEKHGVGLDPIAIAALVDELAARDIEGDQVVAISQGFRLSPAVWGMERKLKDGTFWHADQPLMDWCVGNAKVEQRGNAVLITKQAAGKAKIDPLVAGFNAVMLMSRNPEAKAKINLEAMIAAGEAVI